VQFAFIGFTDILVIFTLMNNPLLHIDHVTISAKKEGNWTPIVKDSSFTLYQNEILGIVGESGSGKSVTSLAIMGLLPKGILEITSGKIEFEDRNISALSQKDLRNLRGNDVAMIFQEPMSSLNPSLKCGYQVEEILKEHTQLSSRDIKAKVLSLFEKVKLPNPDKIYNRYPHEISGGQKQRVMIAMAIACKPKLLIADEPTTALDVTVQKEIILLLKELQEETKMSILFISHDLSLVSQIANRVLVMYRGEIVEQGLAKDIFNNPTHTYTKALISSRPSLNVRLQRLPTIQDYLQDTVNPTEVTPQQRAERLNALYNQPPLLEVINVEKE
jgi:peptide/nickel transport system ATP-binding protein